MSTQKKLAAPAKKNIAKAPVVAAKAKKAVAAPVKASAAKPAKGLAPKKVAGGYVGAPVK